MTPDDLDAANRVHADLTTITSLWHETLEPSSSGGQHVRGSKEPPLPIGAHVLDVRRDALMTLAFWAKVVYDERDLSAEISTVDLSDLYDVVRLLHRHVDWFLEREDGFADDAAHHARKVRELARPERRERVRVGECPVTLAQQGEQVVCGETVWAYAEHPDSIRCPSCGYEDTLDWWREKVAGSRPRLVTARDLVDVLYLDVRLEVTTATVRWWAHKGRIEREGKDDKGRVLYDWAAVEVALAERKWAA